ncbi:GtrA family protein [Actinoplanes sp. NPDC049596]|uniref:GtrA family protein n=1 Tax=unclassified Actinoplanes TaxID=2626549 RepID=UPI00341517DD
MPSAELIRYGLSGGISAATHLGLGLLAYKGFGVPPVLSSAAGFAVSILVSYGLQRSWVFRSPTAHARAGPRFLAVTAVAFTLNAAIVGLAPGPFALVQGAAMVVIPLVNYALNSRWTFGATATRPPTSRVRAVSASPSSTNGRAP